MGTRKAWEDYEVISHFPAFCCASSKQTSSLVYQGKSQDNDKIL